MKKLNKKLTGIVLIVIFMFGLIGLNVAHAATAPVLGTTSAYGIVSSTYTGNIASTNVTGSVCYTSGPGTFAPTFSSGSFTGTCTNGGDQATALNTLTTQGSCTSITGELNAVKIGDNTTGTFPPGCYEVDGAMTITTGTTVTLDSNATGGSGDVWVFRTIHAGALTTGASTALNPSVVLAGTASAANVFWAPAAATSLGANYAASATPSFIGTIIDAAGITLGHFANLSGRALAFGGTVTTDANIITIPNADTTPPTITITSDKTTLKKNENAAITFTLSEVATDFIETDITVAGGLLSNFAAGSGTSYTATFTPTPNSTTLATIDVTTSKFTDPAGNPNTVAAAQNSMTVDTIAPTVDITMSDYILTVGETALVTFTFSEAPVGFAVGDVTSFPNGVLSGFTGSGTSYTATFTPNVDVNDATNVISVGTDWTDAALNPGVGASSSNYTINTVPSSSHHSRGTINVVKIVINDSGGNKTIADFPLFVNGTLVISGVTNTFTAPASMYAVTETNNSNYTQTFSGDCDISGHLNLNSGENKFCIITNNDIGAPLPVVPPLIEVVKVPNPLALPAGPGLVTYTYTVKNIGIVPMTNITLVGDTCVPIVLAAGDVNGDLKLSINETWIYRCSTTLSATHTNTVVATGWANGISAVDIASATVVVGASIIPPLIHVTNIPSPLVLSSKGGAVTYNYTVTNLGVVPLSDVSITDNKCTSLPGRVSGHPGDLNKNNLLESNETWSFTCKTNLTQTTTNIGTVVGKANGLTATDFALATVVVPTTSAVTPGCSGGNLFNTSSGQPCVNNVGNENQNPSVHSGLYDFGTVTLKNGSSGNAVMELQRFLNAKLNLGLVVDGKLGPKTIAVIKQWQKDNGLVADGLVGAKTKAKMNIEENN